MAFAGLTKDREITDIIAYLQMFSADGKQTQLQKHQDQ
jgi:cytochrome c2